MTGLGRASARPARPMPGIWPALAALLPDRHATTDWKALSAAIGLAGVRCCYCWEGLPVEPAGTDRVVMPWQNYAWYRGAVLDCPAQIHLPPVAVKRALHKIGDDLPWDIPGCLRPANRGCHPRALLTDPCSCLQNIELPSK